MKKYRYILTILVLLLIPLLFTTTGNAEEEYPEYPIPPVEKPENFLEVFTYPRDFLQSQNIFPTSEQQDLGPIEPLIIGGSTYTPENLYPWLVSHKFQGIHYCGGTLISPQWVLTAAHCWVDSNGVPFSPSALDTIVLGEYDMTTTSGNEQVIGISEVYIHPLFAPATATNPIQYDFALLKLATPAVLNAYVQPIQLVSPAMGNIETTAAKIMGWGATTYGGPDTTTPRHATISVLADSVCAGAYGIWYDATYALCGGLVDGSADTCQGDSGGPIVINDGGVWKQAGITSWGYQCGVAGYPGVYAKVSTAYDWIYQTIGITRLLTKNPSFEKELPANWFYSQNITIDDGKDCNEKVSGSCSWKLTGNGEDKRIKYFYIPDGFAGETLEFSVWRKGVNTGGTGFIVAEVRINMKDGSLQKKNVLLSSGDVTSWEQFQTTIVASGNYKSIVVALIYNKPGGTIWFDDVSLTKNGNPTNLIANNSFEISMPLGFTYAQNNDSTDGRNCSVSLLGSCSWQLNGIGSDKRIKYLYMPNGVAGDTFDFSIMRKGVNTGGSGWIVVEIRINHNDGSFQKIILNLAPGDMTQWQNFQKTVVASESYKSIVVSVVYNKPGGTLYIDEIEFNKRN